MYGGRLITATGNNTDDTRISRLEITRKQKREQKQLYGRFKRQISHISHAAQNKAIRTNHIKVRIDKTQQNSSGERDETINHIISESSKLAHKEYKARHNWVGKGIHWKLCKKLKFEHTNKWYMHYPESVLENEIHKIHRDFEIQTDHQISARQTDLVIINKKLWTLLSQLTTE